MIPNTLLAQRAAGFIPSPVRDVFELSMAPGMISLAGGNPDLNLMPRDWMLDATAEAIGQRGNEVLQYGSGLGVTSTREAVVEIMASQGIEVPVDAVQITAGSQMGLDVALKLLTDPGDIVLTESLSYTGALSLFAGSGVVAHPVETDQDGLVPSALAAAIAELAAKGKRVRALYTIPDFNNPSGVSMAANRREEIVRLCAEAGVLVLEDAPYRLLSFAPREVASLYSYDPEWVIHLGSFSKILSPGLRVGWVIAPERLRRSLQLACEATVICPTILSQEIASAFIARPSWRTEVEAAAAVYGQRFQALDAALGQHLPPGTTYTRPQGGFFTWVTLPGQLSVDAVLDAAVERKVVFVPGESFAPGGGAADQLRLAFSLETPERLAEGAMRLGVAVAQAMESQAASQAGQR